ncbi:MAG: DUF2231 domain-containing protein [Methylococcaceae bacterium]|jgi:uncharacterized membrane protein|nr:DUF2231 domain-containing protein [Methylococcaceae bacterium]
MFFDFASNLLFSVHAGGEAIIVIMDMLTRFLTLLERLPFLSFHEAMLELLPGILSLSNWHPLFVHFPIVLIPLFFLFDFSGLVFKKQVWREVATQLLWLSVIFAGLTLLTGLLASKSIPHSEEVHLIMESHKHLAVLVFFLTVVLAIWRVSHAHPPVGVDGWSFLGIAGLTSLLVVFTADMGGLMVYQYGVAVAPVMQTSELQHAAEEHEHEPGHTHAD